MFLEPEIYFLIHIIGFPFLIALTICGFMVAAGLMDRPVDRSNHSEATPSAGGVGIVAGLGAALLAVCFFHSGLINSVHIAGLASLALTAAALGLMDDIYDVSPVIKFSVLTLVAIGGVYFTGVPRLLPIGAEAFEMPFRLAVAGAALWIFVVMNGVNFMDGANGMMTGYMLIAFIALAFIGFSVGAILAPVIAIATASALLGFLPYNFKKKADIFAGDVGALTIGFVFGAASLLLVSEAGNQYLYIGPLLFLPFLTDILLTMLGRARRREQLLSAHSSHLYQRLIKNGWGHRGVSCLYMAAGIAMGVVTYLATTTGLIASLYFLLGCAVVMSVIYLAISRGLTRSANNKLGQVNKG